MFMQFDLGKNYDVSTANVLVPLKTLNLIPFFLIGAHWPDF
jgi:hypothetical protein